VTHRLLIVLASLAWTAPAQTFRAQSTSSASLTGSGQEKTLEIHNVKYEATERMLLRETVTSKHILGDKGQESNLTLEAWNLGTDPKLKPLYTVKVPGTGGHTVDGALFVVDRGLEEIEWWSVYRLENGQHLFDTHVPLVSLNMRYAGFEVPEGEQGKTIGWFSYGTDRRPTRQLLLTSDDPKQAAALRSYWDTARTLTAGDERPARGLRLSFQPGNLVVTIPLTGDELDVTHAQLPKGLHLTRK
jgi:hypothetical protein